MNQMKWIVKAGSQILLALVLCIASLLSGLGVSHGKTLSVSAQDISLRSRTISVHKNKIYLGDILQGLSAEHQGIYINDAPGFGEQKTVSLIDVWRVARNAGIPWMPMIYEGENILVKKRGLQIHSSRIQQALQAWLKNNDSDESYHAQLNKKTYSFPNKYQENPSVFVESVHIYPQKTGFDAVVRIGSDDITLRLKGRLETYVNVPVLVHPVKKGNALTAKNLHMVPILKSKVSSKHLQSEQQFLGKIAGRNLEAGVPVASDSLKQAVLIRKKDIVNVHLRHHNLSISSLAESMEEGVMGQTVRLKNKNTGRMFEATVVGHRIAEVIAVGGYVYQKGNGL